MRPRIHRDTLIEMNRASYTARRDAAHARVAKLLRLDVFGTPKEHRVLLYAYCIELLEDALSATQRSQPPRDTPVVHYLQILRDTVAANLALVRHETRLTEEAPEFSRLLGSRVVEQLQNAGDTFSDSEMNGLDCVQDLLKFGEPILQADSAGRTQLFAEDDDRRRYQLALQEYQRFFADATPEDMVTWPRPPPPSGTAQT